MDPQEHYKDPGTFERNIAITDLEMTGFDPARHEILEIGLVLVNQPDLDPIDELSIKVKPQHIETADPESLRVAGYSEEEWQDALILKEAMLLYREKVEDAIFLAHPTTVDWSFIDRAFTQTDLDNPMHYHQLDLFSMAWALMKEDKDLDKVTLHSLTSYFDLTPEPSPHRAINGARVTYKLLKKILKKNSF